MRCRWLHSGAWPVRSCKRRAACLRGSPAISCWNVANGRVLSIFLIFAYRGEFFYISSASRFACAFVSCLALAAPRERVTHRYCGNDALADDLPAAASFACWSASSLPFTSTCPDTQRSVMLISGCFFLTALASWCTAFHRCWPGPV